MKRREFISFIAGGAAVACPLAARAQQRAVPTIGFLNSASEAELRHLVAAFRKGLSEVRYIEGQNVIIEFRWANGQYDRLPGFAADLVNLRVAVIAAGGPPAAHAAKAATSTIPIVFTSGDDPVKSGLVASLNRPGGNVTGISVFTGQLGSKQFGLLRDLLPKATLVGLLVNPNNPVAGAVTVAVQAAAASTGRQVVVVRASSESDLETAFGVLVERRVGALIVGADPFMFARRDLVVALAKRHAIPAMYELREYAAAGGLISYGASIADGYRQLGAYTGRILRGERPADLPVTQPTIFELVLNLKTAKALGLTIPQSLLLGADELIQ